MTAITTRNLRINSAEQLLESVSEPAATYLYVAYGKNTPWANDSLPNTAVDTTSDRDDVWRNIIGGKRVTGNDITLAIKRVNWTTNTVYQAYDDTSSTLYDANTQFYVMTDDYNIYKCLYNNNSANSTVKPTYVQASFSSTEADGYIWKYMYTLNTRDRQKFLTNEWIPVRTLTIDDASQQYAVEQAAVDGAIDVILVTNGGSNYTNTSNVTVTISGDGSDATAVAYVNTISNTIANVVVTTRGTGYTTANVTVSGGGGSNASLRAIIGPQGGHGKDPVYELGGSNILMSVRIDGDEDGALIANNDYRQVSIIKDPLIYNSSNAFTNTVFSQTLTLAIAGSGPDYVSDEYVYQGASLASATFSARVLSWNTSTNIMKVTEYTGTPTTTTLNGQVSGANRFITSISNPNLKNRSGQVIYIDNITPVTRVDDQAEIMKIVIKY